MADPFTFSDADGTSPMGVASPSPVSNAPAIPSDYTTANVDDLLPPIQVPQIRRDFNPYVNQQNIQAAQQDAMAQVAKRENVRKGLNIIKGEDLAARGIPAYRDAQDNIQPVTDDAGKPLTNLDAKSGIAYDSKGEAKALTQGGIGQPPKQSDPFEGIPDWTDSNTGDVYQRRAGLPWKWVGQDGTIAAAKQQQATDKLNQQTAEALGGPISQAHAQLNAAKVSAAGTAKQLNGILGPLDPEDANGGYGTATDDALKSHIESTFNQRYSAPDANATGWFGGGKYTPEAQGIRDQIDKDKASAMQLAQQHVANLDAMGKAKDDLETFQSQQRALQGQRMASINQQRIAAGLPPVEIPASMWPDGQQPTANHDGFEQQTGVPGLRAQKSYTVDQNGVQLNEKTPYDSMMAAKKDGVLNPSDEDQHNAWTSQQFEEAKAGKKLYGVTQNGQVNVPNDKPIEALNQAMADGVVDKEEGKRLSDTLTKAQDAYNEAVKAAGGASQLKALGHGAGLGAAFWGGATPGARAGGTIGRTIGSWLGGLAGGAADVAEAIPTGGGALAAAPVEVAGGATAGGGAGQLIGSILGGLITGSIGVFGARKALEAAGKYSDFVNSLNASAEIHPNYDAAGQFLGMSIGAPKSISNLVNLGKAAASDGGMTLAAKEVGKRVAAGALSGAAFEGGVRPAFDAMKAKVMSAIGMQPDQVQSPTASSIAQNAALGVLLAGHGIEFAHVPPDQIASLLARAKIRTVAGFGLDEAVPPEKMAEALQKQGINVDNNSLAKVNQPLSKAEIAIHGQLADKVKAMEDSGVFDDKQPEFGGATVATAPRWAPSWKNWFGVQGEPFYATNVEAVPRPGEEAPTAERVPALEAPSVPGLEHPTEPAGAPTTHEPAAETAPASEAPHSPQPEPAPASREPGESTSPASTGSESEASPISSEQPTEKPVEDQVRDLQIERAAREKELATAPSQIHAELVKGRIGEINAQLAQLSGAQEPVAKTSTTVDTMPNGADTASGGVPESPSVDSETQSAGGASDIGSHNGNASQEAEPNQVKLLAEGGTSNITAAVEKNVGDLLSLAQGDHGKAAKLAQGYANQLRAKGDEQGAQNMEAAQKEIQRRTPNAGEGSAQSQSPAPATQEPQVRKPKVGSQPAEVQKEPAPVKAIPGLSDTAPHTPEQALGVAKKHVASIKPELDALGVKGVKYANTHSESGIEYDTGTREVRIDPVKLAKTMDAIRENQAKKGIEGTPEDWFAIALEEERIHAGDDAVARAKGQTLKQRYDALPDEAMPEGWEEAGRKAYGSTWDSRSSWQKKAEFVRMFMQGKWTGRITESFHTFVSEIVDFLKGLVGKGTDERFAQHVSELEELLKNADVEKAQRKSTFNLPEHPAGGRDAISVVHEQGGILAKGNAPENISGLYDDMPPSLKTGIYTRLMRGSRNNTPDEMARLLHAEGFGDGTVSGMWPMLNDAVKARQSLSGQIADQVAIEKGKAAEAKRFDAAAKEQARGAKRITAWDVEPGDKVKVGTETMTVRSVDPASGEIIMEDGSKFGIQKVEDGQVVYGKVVSQPKLRAGEKGTGELFQGADQPFNLAGETGVDHDARQREAEQAQRDHEEAMRKQEREQQVIPGLSHGDATLAASESGESDYRGSHKAPAKGYGKPGDDLTGVYPDDIWGGKVETTELPIAAKTAEEAVRDAGDDFNPDDFALDEDGEIIADNRDKTQTIHSVTITPQMREAVMNEGQSLFASAPESDEPQKEGEQHERNAGETTHIGRPEEPSRLGYDARNRSESLGEHGAALPASECRAALADARYSRNKEETRLAGVTEVTDNGTIAPAGLAMDSSGRLYVYSDGLSKSTAGRRRGRAEDFIGSAYDEELIHLATFRTQPAFDILRGQSELQDIHGAMRPELRAMVESHYSGLNPERMASEYIRMLTQVRAGYMMTEEHFRDASELVSELLQPQSPVAEAKLARVLSALGWKDVTHEKTTGPSEHSIRGDTEEPGQLQHLGGGEGAGKGESYRPISEPEPGRKSSDAVHRGDQEAARPSSVEPPSEGDSVIDTATGKTGTLTHIRGGKGVVALDEGGNMAVPMKSLNKDDTLGASPVKTAYDKVAKSLIPVVNHAKAAAKGDEIAGKYDAANTMADYKGQQAANSIRLDIPSEKDREAMPFVIEAGHDPKELQRFKTLLETSRDPKLAKKYAPIIAYAIKDFARLDGLRGNHDTMMANSLAKLNARGIDVAEAENYVTRKLDDPDHIKDTLPAPIFGKPGSGGGAKYFTKGRAFETLADAINAGYPPKSTDLAELDGHRIAAGERLIEMRDFIDNLKKTPAPSDGKPIIGEMERRDTVKSKAAGEPGELTVPRGYSVVNAQGRPIVVHNDFANLFRDLFGQSALRNHVAFRALLKAEAVAKQGTLMLDTFHMGRLLYKMATGGGGMPFEMRDGKPAPNIHKGLALLEYSDADLDRAVKSGEITPSERDYAKAKRPQAEELIRAGLNVGKVADNLMEQAHLHLPFITPINNWIFGKLSRGAMIQTALVNLERNLKNPAYKTRQEAVRQTAKEMNEFFGNLQNQGIFKSKTLQDAARLVFLAPQWTESQARYEGRAYAQSGKSAYNFARTGGKQRNIGNATRAMAIGTAAILAANQVINYLTRGKSTFENPEDGHKLDAWMPGGKRGFFFNPLEISGEYGHAAFKYLAQHENPVDVGTHIASNKLSPIARGAKDALTGRDYSGRHFLSDTDRFRAAITDALPMPMFLNAFVERDPRQPLGYRITRYPAASEHQVLQMMGMKTTAAQSPITAMFALAQPYRPDRAANDTAGEYTQLRRDLDNDNDDGAKNEIQWLRKQGKDDDAIRRAVGVEKNGMIKPENFAGSPERDVEMLKHLTPYQQQLYAEAQHDHVRNALKLLSLIQSVPHGAREPMARTASHKVPAFKFE